MPIKRVRNIPPITETKKEVPTKEVGSTESYYPNCRSATSDFINGSDDIQANASGQPPLWFNAAPIIIEEGWHQATILSVKNTTPAKTKVGVFNQINTGFFLHDQQIPLYQNIQVTHIPNSLILQLVNACIKPNEDINHFNLYNLEERQVHIRIKNNFKSGKTFHNIVEVKPLQTK